MEQGTLPDLSWNRQRERHQITRGTGCCVLSLENERIRMASLRAKNNAGEEVDFAAFADKVVLAVNVARL